jgi:glycosyltransferase involved in cell wall biosynthesis
METVLLILALVTCIILILTIIEFIFGFKQISNLTHVPCMEKETMPSISIIFGALNEETDIEAALTSLLNLNYPNLEVIAVNDRSTDKTPEILERYQKQHPMRLQVFHVTTLPDGWLGKNHALYLGSQYAKGDWLLFTDADVEMKPDTLLKAISYVLKNKIDHLTILEKQVSRFFWLSVFYLGNYITYSMAFKPWRIRYAWSKKFLGHGAFNLVNKQCYQQSGGHRAIALECLDDLQFGKLLKENKFKQDTVDGRDFIKREWYKSLPDLIQGLKKNAFAYYDYKIIPAVRDIFFALFFYIWPLIGACLFTGPIQWLNIANIFLTLFMSAFVANYFRVKKRYIFFYPMAIGILLYTLIVSVVFVYKNKGVVWRGTHYSLEVLKNKSGK